MQVRYTCIILFICLLINNSAADRYSKIESMMSNGGFDNVFIHLEKDNIIITYENRIYRSEHDAIKQVLNFIIESNKKPSEIIIIPQSHGIPLVTTKYIFHNILQKGSNTYVPVSTNYGSGKYWQSILDKKNTSTLNVDFILKPLLNTQFGAFNNPIKKQIGFYTGCELTIKNRLQLNSFWKLMLNNEFSEKEKEISPGTIYLSYWSLLWGNMICSTNIGYFSHNQYGVNINLKIISQSGIHDVLLILGYTGLAYYDNNSWYYSNIPQLSYLLGFRHHFANINADIKLFAGRFVSNDLGVRLEFLRNFGEMNLGYFVSRTEWGRNGGIMLSIPIFPHKYSRFKKVTIRPARYFDWTYNYKVLQKSGVYFKEVFMMDEIHKRLLPGSFINN